MCECVRASVQPRHYRVVARRVSLCAAFTSTSVSLSLPAVSVSIMYLLWGVVCVCVRVFHEQTPRRLPHDITGRANIANSSTEPSSTTFSVHRKGGSVGMVAAAGCGGGGRSSSCGGCDSGRQRLLPNPFAARQVYGLRCGARRCLLFG